MQRVSAKSGFTLVELAIIIVIIGLLVGGVLVGQDLLRSARIRGPINDIEKFNSAATTFNSKYSGLPGDLAARKALDYGLATASDPNSSGAPGLRDGNGLIEDAVAGNTRLSGESALFWKDLSANGMIGGSYTAIGTAVGPAVAITADNRQLYIPRSRIRDITSYHVYTMVARNQYFIGSITGALGSGTITATQGATPLEAKGIDEKIDDGMPDTGNMISLSGLTMPDTGSIVDATTCMDGTTTPKTYNLVAGNSSNLNCMLRIRAMF